MSTVKLCDKCGKQISSGMVLRPVQVMAGDSDAYLFVTAQSYNHPIPRGEAYYEEKDYCKYCIIDAVNAQDDRPKES